MLKKFLISFIFLSFLLTACSKDDRTVLKFSSWGSKSEITLLQPLFKKFESQNPDIKIEFIHIPQNYFQKLHLLFASNSAPDVIFINNHYLPLYANAGVLEDLSGKFDESKFFEKSILKWNNKTYAIPRDVSNLVVYYNKDIFDKYNVPYPNENWTLEDMLKDAKLLTHKPDTFGISFEEKPLFFLPYLMSEGGGILSDDLKTEIINSKESQKGLIFYTNLRKKYGVAPKQNESASATMAQMFLQERLAMHVSGRWLTPKYKESAKFNWATVTFPKGNAGSVVPMDSSGWAVSKQSKNKESAYKLIQFLSSKTSIEHLAKSGLIVPARKDVKSDDDTFNNAIVHSKATPVSVNYKEIIDKLTEKLEPIFN